MTTLQTNHKIFIIDSAMSSPWSHVYTVVYSKISQNSPEQDKEEEAQLRNESKIESIGNY
jgi:hypothetical protein